MGFSFTRLPLKLLLSCSHQHQFVLFIVKPAPFILLSNVSIISRTANRQLRAHFHVSMILFAFDEAFSRFNLAFSFLCCQAGNPNCAFMYSSCNRLSLSCSFIAFSSIKGFRSRATSIPFLSPNCCSNAMLTTICPGMVHKKILHI